ncbi:MAG: MBOAT family O-acyltransferase [Thermodesulfobacteriota bacterium]
MVFNSLSFFLFFSIVLALYYSLRHHLQNRMLLVANYVFYGWWDWRFLSLIMIITAINYYCGKMIFLHNNRQGKKKYLYLSIAANLAPLAFFKYCNFFIGSFAQILSTFGWSVSLPVLHVLLPVGISFYTFQAMTYTIDIYYNKLKPVDDVLTFALYVSFFPQLLSGPIERARELLPQIEKPRSFQKESFISGLQLIYWGLFKKIFVADNLGVIVDRIYAAPSASGMEYIVATWAFAWQLFCDFSGYTDMARGVAKCMGFELQRNFRQPYFVTNPSDFWRHWHISFSSWLRDYLYIPLGGNRFRKYMTYRNLMITMLLGGLWHGANWTFVLWGAFHGALLCLFRMARDFQLTAESKQHSPAIYLFKAFLMFQITCIGWFFFRATDIHQILMIFQQMWAFEFLSWTTDEKALQALRDVLFFAGAPCIVMAAVALKNASQSEEALIGCSSDLAILDKQPLVLKSAAYGVFSYLLCFYGAKAQSFIYFQF